MSVAPLQYLASEFNPLVLVSADNLQDQFVLDAAYVGATGTTPTDPYFAKGCLLRHLTDGTLYQNTSAGGATPTWNSVGNVTPGEITLARGFILVGNSSGVAAAVDANNSGQILVGNGTDLLSVAVSGDASLASNGAVTVSDLTITGETAGDILYFNGTNWVRLPIGTAGQVLTVNAGATAPEWQ